MASLLIVIVTLLAIVAIGGLAIELRYRRMPGNDLELTSGQWDLAISQPNHYLLIGQMEFRNRTQGFEIMVPEIKAEVQLLSEASLDQIELTPRIIPMHPDAPARVDNYWFAYIVKRKPTQIKVSIEIKGENLDSLQSAWVKIHYITYGPDGRIPKTRHVVIPLQYPDPQIPSTPRHTELATVYPIRTHLLTHLDDPVEIVKRYILPHAQPGDVITMGETPLALIQGRFRHPSEIQPGWVAKRVCQFFLPTSSLATACGMQTLVDLVGPTRVLLAFVGGAIAKILGQPGLFYTLAGEQARLIDDVTGTLPPYDQFIVLGPENPQQVVDRIQQETNLAAAIVDVNDLKAVKILAHTADLSTKILEQALRSNPAGNADERTPLVLIRPLSPGDQ
ncbi:F420-0--gamma-glutamyl ligase [Lyngbya sp. PCC 8106]|uniref:F420-0--gamma-glutamyl ligase n=1 Tax=Lyngbya sp. (strain PCC 8106) TaxID=313612 RepID=UPI000304289A|nr:F420-0--gamma-glutamyl ligase [Lyngbya sp. PCC 8106]